MENRYYAIVLVPRKVEIVGATNILSAAKIAHDMIEHMASVDEHKTKLLTVKREEPPEAA